MISDDHGAILAMVVVAILIVASLFINDGESEYTDYE